MQIGSKFGHHVTSLPKFEGSPPGCVTCIAILPWITLLTLSVSIKLVSLSAIVTSVKFQHGLSLTQLERTRHIDRTRRPGSDKKLMGTKELRNRDPNFNEIGTQSQNRDPFYYAHMGCLSSWVGVNPVHWRLGNVGQDLNKRKT